MNSRGDYQKEKKKVITILLVVVAIFLVFGTAYVIIQKRVPISSQERQALETTEGGLFDTPTPKPQVMGSIKLGDEKFDYYDDINTYLFYGTDDTGVGGKATANVARSDYRGSMADSIMILVVNHTREQYMIIPVNRDTMTKVHLINQEGKGEATADIQICTSHWYGGTLEESDANTLKAVSDFLGGVKFDGFYSMYMRDIGKLNNSVGGVEVTIEDDFSKVDKSLKRGETITLSDEQAFTYVHDRYDVGDEKNTSRMNRQQAFLSSFMKKAKEKFKESPGWINDIFGTLKDSSSSDLSAGKLSKIMTDISAYKPLGTQSIEGESKLGKALGDGKEHAEFYANEESLIKILKKIYT
ncbi:MAG: LCP family protein [Eubacterium sp.]|nr:LCP family protein [Eubacterium sp.]